MSFAMEVWSYQERLLACVLRLVSNFTEAEEIVQDTIFKAINKQDTYDRKMELFPWLYTIAQNIFRDRVRHAQVVARVLKNNAQEFIPEPVEELLPAHQNSVKVLFDKVMRFIELNDKSGDREILRLMHEDFTQIEIAEKLSLPLGSVKTRVRLMREKVLEHFGELESHL